jgi:flagellar hook-associated protein 1 FlgK
MSNLFVTGLSGLQAFRQALDVTGQNIANANTDGYVRQRADFNT